MAWVMARFVAPAFGYRNCIRQNSDRIWPDLATTKRDARTTEITRHTGRTVCELFSPRDFLSITRQTKLTGPGLIALEEARANNRPAIVISGHFGNYGVVRAGLIAHGFNVGALYRKMNTPLFHRCYLKNISTIETPLF